MKKLIIYLSLLLLTSSALLSKLYGQTCTAITYSVGTNGFVQFNTITTPTNATASYSWNFGNNTFGGGSAPNVTYTNNGTYFVTLNFATTIPVNSCVATATVVINSCNLTVNYTMPNPINSCNGTATVTGFGLCSPPGFVWSNLSTGSVVGGLCKGTTYSVVAVNNSTNCCPTMTAVLSIPNTSCGLSASFNNSAVTPTTGFVTFTATSTGVTSSVNNTWYWGDGNTTNAGNSVLATHTYSIPGIFTPTLVTTNISPSCVDSYTKTLSVPCAINPSFNFSAIGNGSVSFNSTSTGTAAGASYTWRFGDGSSNGSGLSIVHAFPTSSVYPVKLVVNNNFSVTCRDSITQNVSVVVPIPCVLTADVSATNSGSGVVTFVNLTTGTVSGTAYLWQFGDGSPTSTLTSPQHTYAQNGVYSVTLTATNSPSCFVTFVKTVTVSNVPCQLSANFTHTVSSGGLVNLLGTSGSTLAQVKYRWDYGDGIIGTGNNVTHTYQYNGAYNVKLVVRDTTSLNCADSIIYSINITGLACVAVSAFNLSPSGVPQYWNTTPLYPWNVSNAVWDWGDGSSSNLLYTSHTYSTAGTYSVCLTVTVSCGASSSSCTNAAIYRPQGGSGGMDMVFINVLKPALSNSLPEFGNSLDCALYPNPSDGTFQLKVTGAGNKEIKIGVYDLVGKLVYQEALNGSEQELEKTVSLSEVADGIYFLRLSSEQQTLSKKIVISRQ